MGPVERFTRDDASKYVWSSLMLAAILALIFAFTTGSDAVDQERLASERRAVAAVEQVLEPRLDASDLMAPLIGSELTTLRATVGRSILADPRVARVRIWSAEGTLLFSTDRENLGSRAAFNDDVLRRAAGGTTITRWNLSDTGGLDEQGRSLVRTYTPIGSDAVVEIDQTAEGTVTPVRVAWRNYQILAAALVVLFLFLTVLSLRDPIERINTGVAFAPSSIPAGYSLIDDNRLNAVEEVYRLAHDRVARLEEKLAESETIRRRLEGDIQRSLTQAATVPGPRPGSTQRPASPPAASAPPTVTPATEAPPAAEPRPAPAPAVPAASAAEPPSTNGATRATKRPSRPAADVPAPSTPEVVTVPDSEVLGDPRTAASDGPLARAIREDPSTPRLRPTRAPEEPKRVPRLKRKPEPAPVPVARPVVEPEKPKREPVLKRKPEPVVTVVVPPVVQPDIDDAKAHEAALETFIRLTESDRQHAEADQVDQGAVRAALARTAARKKPGGHRLQPHDGSSEETPGGPRRQA